MESYTNGGLILLMSLYENNLSSFYSTTFYLDLIKNSKSDIEI